jgi:cytochrome c-type biogenesis protein CcmH
MMLRLRCLLPVLILMLICGMGRPAFAVQPDEILDNPKLEHEARQISAGLRCLVCQNQSIDDSDAPLAHDLRVLVRDRLKAGDTPQQVVDYVVARYGEFILLRPRFSAHTVLLWLAPLLLLGAGGSLAYRVFRRDSARVAVAPTPLSDDEQRKLDTILSEKGI